MGTKYTGVVEQYKGKKVLIFESYINTIKLLHKLTIKFNKLFKKKLCMLHVFLPVTSIHTRPSKYT